MNLAYEHALTLKQRRYHYEKRPSARRESRAHFMETHRQFGRYEVVAELGRGAMGIVYKARDPQIDRLVALKTISLHGQEPEEEKEFRERFLREAQAAGRLQHPGLVAIYDAGEDEQNHDPYIVLEFVGGESLNRVLAREKKLPLPRALQLAEEIADALDYAHAQGVIHRDIKPANILLTEDGHAKIADFGIAQLNLAHFTLPGRVLGTPAFMAPEQLSGEGVDGRSDLFSLGVVLYAMVTGHSPFHGNSATTVCFKVVNRDPVPASAFDLGLPRALDAVISKAMAKDPEQRYQRGSEFAADLRTLRLPTQTGALPALSVSATGTASAWTSGIRQQSPQANLYHVNQHVNLQHVNLGHAQQIIGAAIRRMPLKYLVIAACAVVALTLIALPARQAMKFQRTAAVASPAPLPTAPQASAVADAQNSNASPTSGASTPAVATPGSGEKPRPTPKLVRRATVNKLQIVASAAPIPQPANPVVAVAASTLELAIEHQFKDATLSVWIDDQLALTRPLHGESQKKLVVFKGTRGVESESLQISAGTHRLRVRAQSSDESIDLSKTISADFSPGADRTLQISFEKHNSAMRLEWQ
jgi:eukaryotic-like serine/threonine-protein kinase